MTQAEYERWLKMGKKLSTLPPPGSPPPSPTLRPTPSGVPEVVPSKYGSPGFGITTDQRGREIVHPTAAQRKAADLAEQKAAAPILGPLAETLGYGNAQTSLLGAGMLDMVEGRADTPFGPATAELWDSPATKKRLQNEYAKSATAHAYHLLFTGRSQEAADTYFPTSPKLVSRLADDGFLPAQVIRSLGPSVGAGLDAVARFADPGGLAVGMAADAAGGALRTGARVASRAAARKLETSAPKLFQESTGTAPGFLETLRYGEHTLLGARRFGAQRGAAEDIARKRYKVPWYKTDPRVTEAGDKAEMAFRNIANAQEYGLAEGQRFANYMYDGLKPEDNWEVMHVHEGDSNIDPVNRGPNDPVTTAEQMQFNRIMPAVLKWREYGAGLDNMTREWLGDDVDLISSERYFPRKGLLKAPGVDALSDGEEHVVQASRSLGGAGVRKGTLAFHRKFGTGKQAMENATATGTSEINPFWVSKDTVAAHVGQRVQAHRIYTAMKDLEDVGLLSPRYAIPPVYKDIWVPTKKALPVSVGPKGAITVPPELQKAVKTQIAREATLSATKTQRKLLKGVKLTPEAYRDLAVGTMTPAVKRIQRLVSPGVEKPRPPGFLPFTDFGTIRSYGLPLSRESYVDPTVATGLYETRGIGRQESTGVPGFFGAIGQGINRAAAQWQVQFAPYHVGINLRANVASALRSPSEWLTFARNYNNPDAIAHAKEVGAFRPYTDPQIFDKMPGALGKTLRTFHNYSAKPLYENFEPRIAAGLQAALEPRLGEKGAALEVRNILGEPENIPTSARDIAQVFEFPAWFLSQMRRWSTMPFRRPNMYNSAQAGIRDWNSKYGRSPQNSDQNRMFPPIMLGYTPFGDRVLLEVPHPADRPMRLMGSLGQQLSGDTKPDPEVLASVFAGAVNPSAQQAMRNALRGMRPLGEDKDWANDVAAAAPPDTGKGPLAFARGAARYWLGTPTQLAQNAAYWLDPVPQLLHTEMGTRTINLGGGKHTQVNAMHIRNQIVGAYVNGNYKLVSVDPGFRYGIKDVRNVAEKLDANPDLVVEKGPDGKYTSQALYFQRMMNYLGAKNSADLTARANYRYGLMQKELTKWGFPTDPLSPGSAPMSWKPWVTIPELFKVRSKPPQ